MLIGSTIETSATDKWTDGQEYPLTTVDVSSASHPFYTGQEKVMDTAGRASSSVWQKPELHAARKNNIKNHPPAGGFL